MVVIYAFEVLHHTIPYYRRYGKCSTSRHGTVSSQRGRPNLAEAAEQGSICVRAVIIRRKINLACSEETGGVRVLELCKS